MITVKYIPNIFNKEGRQEVELQYVPLESVETYLRSSHYAFEGQRIIVSGKRVTDLKHIVEDSDEIIVTPEIAFDPATWAVIVTIWNIIVVIATIAAIAYSIYAICTYKKPTQPNFGSDGDGLDESSPTYGWEGIQTTQDVGIPIAIVYGTHKVGGNIINAYISTDGQDNYLNVLLALCEGEIDSVSDIKINDQPIANYAGCASTTKVGTNSDAVIPNFEDLHSVNDVSQTLNNLNSTHTYTTVLDNIEAFEVRLKFPSGLFMQDSSDGAILNWQVSYKIEYKLHSDSGWTTLGTYTVDEKMRTELKKYHSKIGLTAGQYDIKVTRTTAAGDFYHTGDLTLLSIDEIRTADLAYPNVAKLGIKALATEQLSGGMPQFSCIVKGKKVETPNVTYGGAPVAYADYYYDPVALKYKRFSDDAVCTFGGDYITAYSANPIWCLYDLLTNARYGLGEYINTALMTKSEWLTMSQYCDEKVSDGNSGYEKRFMLDIVIDSNGKALDILSQIAGCFRGIIFYSGGYIKVVIDKVLKAVKS